MLIPESFKIGGGEMKKRNKIRKPKSLKDGLATIENGWINVCGCSISDKNIPRLIKWLSKADKWVRDVK